MIEVIRHFQLRDHCQLFSHQGEGINPVVYFKCFDLAFVPVHEISLANQLFCSTLFSRAGVCTKSTLCTLVKMLKIMDSP